MFLKNIILNKNIVFVNNTTFVINKLGYKKKIIVLNGVFFVTCMWLYTLIGQVKINKKKMKFSNLFYSVLSVFGFNRDYNGLKKNRLIYKNKNKKKITRWTLYTKI